MKCLKTILFLFQFLLIEKICLAQELKIDSLNKVLPILNDSAKIDCLNSLSKAYVYHQMDSAKKFAQKAIIESENINYKNGLAAGWVNLAWAIALAGGDLRTMESYCRKAILLLNETSDKKLLAESWFALACALSSQCKYAYSLTAFDKAGELFLLTGDELGRARMFTYMGDEERNKGQYNKSLKYAAKWLEVASKYNDNTNIDAWASLYAVMGDYETALEYYNQGYESKKASKKIDFELIYYLRMKGDMFLLLKKYDSARYYFKLAIQNSQQTPLNLHWGRFYLEQKKYDSALLHLNNALIHSKKINDLFVLQLAYLNLSKAYKETGKTQIALHYARELLQTSAKTGARPHTRDGHFILYQLFAQSGNHDSAFSHLQKYTLLKDTIDKDLTAQKLAFYKIRAEKEGDQARINLLNEEKKLHQLQLNQTAQERKFLIIGISGILLLSGFLLRNLILKRKNEANHRRIAENELRLQKLESEKTTIELQQKATELEMQALRAQMNPHFIFNSLNSINRFILQNDRAQASEYLTKFSRLIRLILQNSQAPLITLESELESLHLYLELESVRFENHFTFKIIVDKDLDTDIHKVPPLIIQPFTENAIWHGLMNKKEGGHLEIKLFEEDNILCCKITDDGIGRIKAAELKSKSATTHKSMGMQITANRINMLQQNKQMNSTIKITDLILADGNAGGTEVLLKIPFIK